MENSDVFKKIAAALFFLIGIYLTVMLILTIGSDKGISKKKFQIEVIFSNVGGLMEGAPVRLSGVNIGNVADIDFLEKENEHQRVRVKLNIYQKFRRQLQQNAQFSIRTEGILGEKLVEIYPLSDGKALDLSKPINGEDPMDIQNMTAVFAGAASAFTKTAEELGNINMMEMAEVMTESSRALLETSEGINAIMVELQEIARKSKRIFDRLEQKVIEGDLFKVF